MDMNTIKHHELTLSEWTMVREKIREMFGDSMILLRAKMRRELGFSVRRHTNWVPKMDGGYYDDIICIDFYTEEARTFFLLSYT
jgi:hypothetical protein